MLKYGFLAYRKGAQIKDFLEGRDYPFALRPYPFKYCHRNKKLK